MPQPVQFYDFGIESGDAKFNSAVKLPVGAGAQAGDLRVVIITTQWDTTITPSATFTNWTGGWRYAITGDYWPGSAAVGYGVFTRVLQPGDVDGRAYYSFPSAAFGAAQIAYFTVKNWNPGQTLTGTPMWYTAAGDATAQSSPITYPVAIAGRSVAAGSAVIYYAYSVDDGVLGLPPGTTGLGDTGASGAHFDPNPETIPPTGPTGMLFGSAFSTAGTSPTLITHAYTTTAGEQVSPGIYRQTETFVFGYYFTQSPDIAVAVGGASETDTAGTVTPTVSTTTTTVRVGGAVETDTAGAVNNPLMGIRTSNPLMLTGDPVLNSRIEWTAYVPVSGLFPSPTRYPSPTLYPQPMVTRPATPADVLVETSIDNGATWQTATSGLAVPRLVKGNTTAPTITTRVTLRRPTANAFAPVVTYLNVEVALDASRDELCPLGVYVIHQTDVTEGASAAGGGGGGSGAGLSLKLTGSDLSYELSRRTWEDIFYLDAGTNVMDGVRLLCEDRLPGLSFNLTSTPHETGRWLFGTQQGSDPWQDIQGMMTAIGYEAFFDAYGVLTTRPIPDAISDSAVLTISDGTDGGSPVIAGYTRSPTDKTTYNYVVVTGENSQNVLPLRAVAFDDDPTSGTYIYGPYGVVATYFTSPMIRTLAQAQQVADALLRAVRGVGETVTLSIVPNPALEAGDTVKLLRPVAQLNGSFLVNGFTLQMGPKGPMDLTCFRQTA